MPSPLFIQAWKIFNHPIQSIFPDKCSVSSIWIIPSCYDISLVIIIENTTGLTNKYNNIISQLLQQQRTNFMAGHQLAKAIKILTLNF